MKILITGIDGQLGRELIKKKDKNFDLIGLNKTDFNLLDQKDCEQKIFDIKPDWIINAAAFTQVDIAEEKTELAYLINSNAVEFLAKTVSVYRGRLLHISTDFVFNGNKKAPYFVNDKCAPLNVYGSSKLKGEKLSLKYPGTLILRTSWLYSNFGENFYTKIFNLHKNYNKQSKPIKIINDQFGSPTTVDSLADACWKLIIAASNKKDIQKIFHWSNSGVISWYQFAKAIGEVSEEIGLINKAAPIIPIRSYQYQSNIIRPKYSALDCNSTCEYIDLDQIKWQDALKYKLIQKSILDS